MWCCPPADPFFAGAVAAAIMAVHPPSLDRHQDKRLLLERERAELRASIEDPAWMRDHGRATLARLSVERGWRRRAENEAAASAKRSEKPARLLAEEALAKCGEWKRLLRRDLENGAYQNGRASGRKRGGRYV